MTLTCNSVAWEVEGEGQLVTIRPTWATKYLVSKRPKPIKTEQQQQKKLEVKKNKPGGPSETVWISLKEVIWRVWEGAVRKTGMW